jgi:hypothetical protein
MLKPGTFLRIGGRREGSIGTVDVHQNLSMWSNGDWKIKVWKDSGP